MEDKYIGRLLDNRYEILEVIGNGGMAVVYKARCHRLNRLVAIKILKEDNLSDEDFRRRFHAESQAVAMLSHPNIVSVYDVSTSIMADYIVMELIEGISLKQYMEKKGVLNWKETLHFAIQIAKALEHAHSRGIVHRDIKPHNVMVLKNGSVKVTDFGIARMMSKGNTLTKEALGSVHYISPEQAKGGRVDSRSDIYSLGVVMYEMMTGRTPYDGDSPVSVAIQHINGGARMPSTLNPNIPGGLEQIIMKAMAHQIADRYASSAQMLSDMDEFRKDPTVLFDYNTPPTDEVTRIQQPPLVLQPEPTVAEKVAGADIQRRRPQTPPADKKVPERQTPPQRRRQPAKNEEPRSRTATVAIIICSIVAVIAIAVSLIAFFSDGFGPKEVLVDVSPLVGQSFEDLPNFNNLQIIHEEVYDEQIPAGQIIKQEPSAGIQVVEGTKIVVTVSKGPTPKIIKMDDLTNLTAERAAEILNNLGLNLEIKTEEEYHDEIKEGNVIRHEPAKDVTLNTGDTVTLYVSLGVEIKTGKMPNLVDVELDAAQTILKNQNLDLKITVEEVFDSVIAPGKVVDSDPKKGEELRTGQAIKLLVSKGPETAKMPDVVGIDIDKAVNILIAAGFNIPDIVGVESDVDKDVVIRQSFDKDELVDVNAEIILEVSKGPVVTTPSETTEPQVTKDVVVLLKGYADLDKCQITVTRDGVEVYNGTVAKGATSITIPGQTGNGIVYYEVMINQSEGWIQKETF